MGKSKNLLENEIVTLRKQSKTFTEIANIACIAINRKTIFPKTTENNTENRSPDSSIVRKGFVFVVQIILLEINYGNDTQISARTVKRRLEDFNLRGQNPKRNHCCILEIEKDDLHLLKLISIGQVKIVNGIRDENIKRILKEQNVEEGCKEPLFTN
ncbi:hypothetical protein WN51_04614 [Melipona quadrifasciata]|uniref:Uncharacterized protein n=1 Tax=Melipona quadrifasciata TaxID=166423 RepID=A0A0N0U410_9HYME|nr:hypothetical protein WN51_04614 [Melipona quadrifasciata]